MTPRVAVLVPVYNEARFLGGFLERLKLQGLHVLVVDDGSTDGSLEVAGSYGAETLSLPVNSGKGSALRAGFSRLLEQGFDWIIVMDGDGQHRPEEIPRFLRFLEEAAEGGFGIINGTRLENPKGMPLVRLLTNRFMSYMVGRIAGQPIRDSQCGYKMLSADFIRCAELHSNRFEIEDELLLEAVRLKYKIAFVPVTTVYGEEDSHIRPMTDTVRFLRFVARWIGRFGKPRP